MFSLPKSVAQLPDINEGLQNARYEQVAPSRDVTLSNFPNGMQHFKWEVSGNKWWCPQKSYMRYRVRYTKNDENKTQLEEKNQVSPAPFMVSNLYQSAEFLIGDRVVGRIGQYMAQIDALKQRMSKSKPWLDSLGEVSNFASVNDSERRGEVVVDGSLRGASDLECIWTPPLNIFHQSGCLPSGKYELRLSPENASQFKKNSVLNGIATEGANSDAYDFEITDVYLYIHTIEGANVSNMTYAHDLENIHCQADKIQNAGLTQRYFDVSPSTIALAVAYQDVRVNDEKMSGSKFTCSPDTGLVSYGGGIEQNKLSRFFISYANMQKPQPDADPQYDSTANARKNRIAQRYNETQLESAQYFNPAGCETYQEWLARGLYMLYNFPKSGEDSSTRVQVNSEFGNDGGAETQSMRILLFSISRTSAQITISNGQVSDVVLKER